MLILLWALPVPTRALPLLALLALAQASTLPPLAALRLLLAHLVGWRSRGADPPVRALLLFAAWLDRCHSAEWSGQDWLPSALFLLPLLMPWRHWRQLLAFLCLSWMTQLYADFSGLFGWLRPLPHGPEWGALPLCPPFALLALLGAVLAFANRTRALLILPLALLLPNPSSVKSRNETRRLLGGPVSGVPELAGRSQPERDVDWLLLSNNPERVPGSSPVLLLQQSVPAGRGRILVSHMNLSLRPKDLVISSELPFQLLSQASSRDGERGRDAGSVLTMKQQRTTGECREFRLPRVIANGIVQLEVELNAPTEFRVGFAERGHVLPDELASMREGQSRGLYSQPDRQDLLPINSTEWRRWDWNGPWLRNEQNEPLLGNYGCIRHLTLEVQTEQAEVWLVARGGVLGTVDGRGAPMLAAGQSRRLALLERGTHRLDLTLPVNSFAPYSLAVRGR